MLTLRVDKSSEMKLMAPMFDKSFSPDKQSAFDARFEAQKIAFGPVVFQCVRYAWKRGMLEALAEAGETGLSVEALAATGRWTPYALKLVLETCLSCGVVRLSGGRYVLEKAGYCVLSDSITQINLNFVHDVCYQGLFDLDKSLDEERPIGLKTFGDWTTIYEGLSKLPEPARSSWFKFDHHYSDTSFPSIMPDVFATAPARVMDIGANTGKFSRAALEYDKNVELHCSTCRSNWRLRGRRSKRLAWRTARISIPSTCSILMRLFPPAWMWCG